EYPDRASWIVNSRSSTPREMAITMTDPAGSGRVISEQIVAPNRQRNPQLRGANPACGDSQIAAATRSGAAQRQGPDWLFRGINSQPPTPQLPRRSPWELGVGNRELRFSSLGARTFICGI